MLLPLSTPAPMISPVADLGRTARTRYEVPGPSLRLSEAVVRTLSPAMKPPAGRVGGWVGASIPGVRVVVGEAGVLVGVEIGTGRR